MKPVETNIDALHEITNRYPHLEIEDAVDDGACDSCPRAHTLIYRTDEGWKCGACLAEYAAETTE